MPTTRLDGPGDAAGSVVLTGLTGSPATEASEQEAEADEHGHDHDDGDDPRGTGALHAVAQVEVRRLTAGTRLERDRVVAGDRVLGRVDHRDHLRGLVGVHGVDLLRVEG